VVDLFFFKKVDRRSALRPLKVHAKWTAIYCVHSSTDEC